MLTYILGKTGEQNHNTDSLVHEYSITSALAMEIQQSCTKPMI